MYVLHKQQYSYGYSRYTYKIFIYPTFQAKEYQAYRSRMAGKKQVMGDIPGSVEQIRKRIGERNQP
jgi:hypothetical protein